jgi:hypothetical protein
MAALADANLFQSVSFTGVSGFLLAALWFIFFGMATVGRCYFRSRMAKEKVSHADAVRPVLLVVFALTLM